MSERTITLKAARVNAGLTQQEAADALGISRKTLGNYEQGKRYPKIETIQKIEKLYDMPYTDIKFICD